MKLVDLIQNWSEPKEITDWGVQFQTPISPAWDSYINMEIHPDDMIVLFKVIFPTFVEVDGCVLLGMKALNYSEENLLEFKKQATSQEVFERQFNTFRLYELFVHSDVKYESSFEQAAKLLKQSWEVSLRLLFPTRLFDVLLSNSDEDYGPTLTFFSKSK